MRSIVYACSVVTCIIGLQGCASTPLPSSSTTPPIALALDIASDETVEATYSLTKPVRALHFAQNLGGYREDLWRPEGSEFRWIREGDGERIERTDGQSFDRLTFDIPIDYRALPKNYAPFSPFSDRSTLIYSGHFQACTAVPCDGEEALPITISATGKTIGVSGHRTRDRAQFVSEGAGTNIFVGNLKPVAADGFVAIIDPGLPTALRQHLDRSLPQSIRYFSAIYGPLSFVPELYVSMDDRPEPNGGESTQGGTLPNQIFMHFDGAHARQRATEGSPLELDWFFAHEAAHLFQQNGIGKSPGDDAVAWIHEGGAEAMAALALASRGAAEREYVPQRVDHAATNCATGLAHMPLDRATTEGKFDLHYQCGLVFWLALDQSLREHGHDGLADLNRAFFAKVRAGEPWSQPVFMTTAKELGVPDAVLSRIETLTDGGYDDAAIEIAPLEILARRSLKLAEEQ